MKWVQARVVDGLEVACRGTRLVEWIPGWHRVYPQCFLARLSSGLDHRWGTGRWSVHDEDGYDAWEQWWEGLSEDAKLSGHWHHW